MPRTRLTTLSREVAELRPAPGAHRVAARAATVLGAALVTCWLAGRLDLAIYATFGAFASVYGGPRRWAGRWRLQAGTGALLTLAVTSGALVATGAHRAWWGVAVTATWAAAAAALSDRHGWRPPGPLFFVFACATCSAVPIGAGTVPVAAGVAAATATGAVLLGAADSAAAARPEPPPEPLPLPRDRRRLHAIRCACAVLVAGTIATAAGIDRPYWAMVASVVPLAAVALRAQAVRGAQRLAGTILGLGLAAALLALRLDDLWVVVTVAALQGLTELVVTRNYALALVFITPLALLVTDLAVPQPVASLLWDRLLETCLGVLVGVAVAVATRPRLPR